MIDHNTLTRDSFLSELYERLDALRLRQVEVPTRMNTSVMAVVGGPEDPFDHEAFRLAAAHLLEGISPAMADKEGGPDLIEDRLAALSANLQLSLRVAAERHEHTV